MSATPYTPSDALVEAYWKAHHEATHATYAERLQLEAWAQFVLAAIAPALSREYAAHVAQQESATMPCKVCGGLAAHWGTVCPESPLFAPPASQPDAPAPVCPDCGVVSPAGHIHTCNGRLRAVQPDASQPDAIEAVAFMLFASAVDNDGLDFYDTPEEAAEAWRATRDDVRARHREWAPRYLAALGSRGGTS